MKITCQSCQSKYTVSDEKVQGKTVKIKCRKCGATIIVNSAGASQSNGGTADPISTTGGDGSYLVNVTEGDQRTMTIDELMTAYNSGVVTAETYIWSDGMADWQPLGQVDAVVAALNAAAPASAIEPAYEAPAPAPEPAPRAAAVRRDPRRSQDLFGGGMAAQTAHDDVATSAPLFQAPVAPSPMTGQREENSTLFSLSALTAKAAVGSAPSRTTATKEDSGLIDLKALAEAAPVAPPVNLVADHGGLFPLGAPIGASPASVHPGAPGSIPAPGKKSPVFVIVGGAVAIVAIICVFLLVKGGGDKPVASADPNAAAATAAPPVATATATAAATAAPTASASAEASADASSSPSATAKAKGGGRGRPGAGKGGPAAAAPAAAAPAAAKPGKGNCGCAAGDLMCAMKCSAH